LSFLAAACAAGFNHTRMGLRAFCTVPAFFRDAFTVPDNVGLVEQPIDLFKSEIGSFRVAEVLLSPSQRLVMLQKDDKTYH
jgi:hypothetical protein